MILLVHNKYDLLTEGRLWKAEEVHFLEGGTSGM